MGPILAATILGTVGEVARFPTKAHFASSTQARHQWRPREWEGGAPQALYGRQQTPQNYALHMVATSQARSDAPGGTYYRKKMIDEGKSSKEALRCLKRRVSDAVYKRLTADTQAPSSSAA